MPVNAVQRYSPVCSGGDRRCVPALEGGWTFLPCVYPFTTPLLMPTGIYMYAIHTESILFGEYRTDT